jgi:hypothetical protein
MRCKYKRHRDYIERGLRCPDCRASGYHAGYNSGYSAPNPRKEARLATAGMGRALGDFVRHAWAWLRLQLFQH